MVLVYFLKVKIETKHLTLLWFHIRVWVCSAWTPDCFCSRALKCCKVSANAPKILSTPRLNFLNKFSQQNSIHFTNLEIGYILWRKSIRLKHEMPYFQMERGPCHHISSGTCIRWFEMHIALCACQVIRPFKRNIRHFSFKIIFVKSMWNSFGIKMMEIPPLKL